MDTVLNELGQKLYEHGNHVGYFIRWNLISPLCKKWSRNRDPDMKRVEEMYSCEYVPRLVHLADLKDEGIVCYDGNHRRETFNRCTDESLHVVIDLMRGATQSEVYEAFQNINKSVQVPALYFEPVQTLNLDIIQYVHNLEKKYSPFVSSSARCHAPNFNRDTCMDLIHKLYKSFDGLLTIPQIGTLLDALNVEYANNRMCRPHSQFKSGVVDKCKKHNFWLFIDHTVPIDHVHRIKDICTLDGRNGDP